MHLLGYNNRQVINVMSHLSRDVLNVVLVLYKINIFSFQSENTNLRITTSLRAQYQNSIFSDRKPMTVRVNTYITALGSFDELDMVCVT